MASEVQFQLNSSLKSKLGILQEKFQVVFEVVRTLPSVIAGALLGIIKVAAKAKILTKCVQP